MSKSIRVERDIPMKVRDGITLRADVYRPDDVGSLGSWGHWGQFFKIDKSSG
jgi:predicted acyl esterase